MKRIVFLDYLRVLACFMVIVIHSVEPYYLGGEGVAIASKADFAWVTFFECLCRACVPLFVMASAYLLFPVTKPTDAFFRRRFGRVVLPFAIWSFVYVALFGGEWGQLAFNFPDAGGHLWFVPMLVGLYLAMPLLSPWAERVSKRELRGWLILWGLTLTFPFVRRLWLHLYGAPSFGSVAYLWGECPWNGFGTFQYVSGFIGYMLLGFYIRKFDLRLSWLSLAALWLAGASIMASGFSLRLPSSVFPISAPYAAAVEMEMAIEYCGLGVAMTVLAVFLAIRRVTSSGWFYTHLVLPLSQASYGTYLVHLAILLTLSSWIKPHAPTPLGILSVAVLTFLLASLVSMALGKIPKIGRALAG